MTAEIAVMNRIAIALAADSAATSFSGKIAKIYNTADKLFHLDDREPIAAMIYGSANFMGIPWEVLIKLFRAQHSQKRPTVADYGGDFLKFLASGSWLTDEIVDQHFKSMARTLVRDLFQTAAKTVKSEGIALSAALSKVLTACITQWSRLPLAGSITGDVAAQLSDRYKDFLEDLTARALRIRALSGERRKARMKSLIILFATRDVPQQKSGIVVAGFGSSQLFPALAAWELDCTLYPRHLRFKQTQDAEISITSGARIVPFAQAEMVHSFMEGIDPRLQSEVSNSFGTLLDKLLEQTRDVIGAHLDARTKENISQGLRKTIEALKEEFQEKLSNFSRENYVDPVLDAVELLPKDQLAVMAETLVALTSFKRKMSRDTETVGGAIDVAVISKGDGLIWTKRKHYFDPALNPRYLNRIQRTHKRTNESNHEDS
jgi:hypothetical protein